MSICLADIPDFSDWPLARKWVEHRLETLEKSSFSSEVRDSFCSVSAPDTTADPVFGLTGDPGWRKFMFGLFLADWSCYDTPADRVDFARLLFVTQMFPAGFRLWTCILEDGIETPVGYTGWYPVSETVFQTLEKRPDSVTHRGFMFPLRETGNSPLLYLFNYSIVPQLRKTPQSKALLETMAKDMTAIHPRGLAAVTVSEDGIRVAKRYGLKHTGDMVFEGEREGVYTCRFPT